MDTTWFSEDDIEIFKPIKVYNLHGLVLPHAGTKYSGKILSHTLRYRPKKKFDNIVIFSLKTFVLLSKKTLLYFIYQHQNYPMLARNIMNM